jgi:hypothetical protein
MLSVIMLSVVMLSVIVLRGVILGVIVMSVIILSIIMLSVVVPKTLCYFLNEKGENFYHPYPKTGLKKNYFFCMHCDDIVVS